jgi:transglutaminase/protease-like cytokinesis protein 3
MRATCLSKIAIPFFLIILSSFELLAISKDSIRIRSIDSLVFKTPVSETKNIERLSQYLAAPWQTDVQKVRSLYGWIVNNISYDHKSAANPAKKKLGPKNTLKLRKGVCIDYSELLQAMCKVAGIDCRVIAGYSRIYNFNAKVPFTWSDHAWNAVKIANQWYLLDVTWAHPTYYRGIKTISGKYFLTDPKVFLEDHLPENPKWQLLTCPITIEQFKKSKPEIQEIVKNTLSSFNFADSILHDDQLLEPEKELREGLNSYAFNKANHLSIGVALSRYGYYLSKTNKPLPKSKSNLELRILREEEALSYYKKAMVHLKKTEREYRFLRCRKNIKYVKKKITHLKKKKRQLKETQKTLV